MEPGTVTARDTKTSDKPIIRVENLAKTFRIGFTRKRVRALRDASFEVPSGCVFGLVGPNGAGKTTTIKILMGLIRASSGRAEMCGVSVPSVASRKRVGYLPENPHFYDHLRPIEFLVYVGRLYGMSGAEARRKAGGLLEMVGLAGQEDKPTRKFSKGMIQRLGIAQTLLHDPQVVILDEPQSGLDPIGRREVKDIIADLGQRGRTVFFSSHILSDVEDVCDRVAVMINGVVRDVGHVDSLLSPKLLSLDVEVSGLSEQQAAPLAKRATKRTKLDQSLLLTFPGETDADALLEEIGQAGGRIHRLVPHRERLEDLFVRQANISDDGGEDV